MSNELVLIARAFSVSEAMVIQSMLSSNGIETVLFDINTVNLDPGMMWAVGGVRIMGLREDADAAWALINEGQSDEPPPRSYDPHPVKNGIWATILTLMGVPPPARIKIDKD
jgi:Putative prokaryotic signal transducing protein